MVTNTRVCVLHVSGELIVPPDFSAPFFLKLIRIQNKQVARFCTYQLTIIDFWNFDVGTCLKMFPIILADMNPLLHWNVWLLLFHSQDLPPAHLCLCVEVGVLCIHKTQNSNPLHSFLAFGNKISSCGEVEKKISSCIWGPPLQTVYEGIRGSLTAASNTHPAWPPRLWPLDTLKMRVTWKEGIVRAFPRDEFDHTSSKNESLIPNSTKARVESVLEFWAGLLGEALFFYCLHWARECHNND